MVDIAEHSTTSNPSYDIRASSASESETFSTRQSRHCSKFSDSSSRDSSTTSHTSISPEGKPRRRSVFTEVGLDDFDEKSSKVTQTERPRRPRKVRFRSKLDIHEANTIAEEEGVWTSEEESSEEGRFPSPPIMATTAASPFPSMPRIFLFVFMLAFVLPTLHNSPLLGKGISPIGVKGGVIRNTNIGQRAAVDAGLEKRDDPVNICKRWSQQSAVVNGTMYLYGGRMMTDGSQTSDTWNNDFNTIDLTRAWKITTPTLKTLPQPSGPPPVANGYLWNSFESLYLYGGEFSDNPVTSPVPFSLWEYDIAAKSWKEHENPQTTSGKNSAPANQPVQRTAEGAGLTIPEIGRGFYFGGHLDGYTTPGWSQSIWRVYIRSMIEYTFPGYSNDAIQSLSGGKKAGEDGVWRNITTGGLQEEGGFTERADGVLVYIPGYGKQGIILGLAGGTNTTFTQMNIIDVYDIASSTWYKQATSGKTPGIRVNPCAVVATAADGSSSNVYLYGGQNLIPYGDQKQYDDMWILTVPSFTWISVKADDQSVPPARAGHTCSLWNGQIVVVGGYVGQDIACDSPGIYVFDASTLTWNNTYVALGGGNNLNQQAAQQKDPAALGGSYGYRVPKEVQSVIGGNDLGKATVTAPAQAATDGPMATGKPITYTVTDSHGAQITETSTPTSGGTGSNGTSDSDKKGGHNIAAIVAGVVAGCLAILAGYLAFCVYVYRKQLTLYKNHVAMAQRAAAAGAQEKPFPFMVTSSSENTSNQPSTGTDAIRVSGDDRGSGPGSQGHQHSTSTGSAQGTAYQAGYTAIQGGGGSSSKNSSTDDLMAGQEPSFLGVLLNPRRSLRVVNRD